MSAIVFLPLSQGKVAIIDFDDLEKVRGLKFSAVEKGDSFYALCRSSTERGRRLHRIIMDAPAGLEVDHKNGDQLDNRRANLRLATRSQNAANVGKRSIRATSAFKGVSWDKRLKTWVAALSVKVYHESFDTEEQAARAYDAEAKKRFGEFAKLNFPSNKQKPN